MHYLSRSIPSTLAAALFGVLLLAGATLISGCADSVLSEEDAASEPQARFQTQPSSKFRNAHLLDRAIKSTNAGKSAANDELGLIVVAQSGIDKQRLVARFKLLHRFKLVERFEYDNVLYGFAWTIEDLEGANDYQEFLDALANDPEILWFEPDFSVDSPISSAAPGGTGQRIPWSVASIGGLDSWTYSGNGWGATGVDLFVLDTGISNDDVILDSDLDFREGLNDPRDYDGHGTHVAGIAAAVDDADGLVGVAPGARLHNLKVLDDTGKADVSVVIAAIEHITVSKLSKPDKPMVVNLSLGEDMGTPNYSALDEAIMTSTATGVVYIVAAGNQGVSASHVTPAKVADAITVGSFGFNGSFSPFSNYGPKVDILAPGEGIVSLEPSSDGPGSPVEMSGTSMSAAHVSGAAALYLGLHPDATPAEVKAALLASAKTFVVGAPSGTTNKSVWVGGSTFRDEFNGGDFVGDDGATPWTGPWLEDGESDGESDGTLRVTSSSNMNCPEAPCMRIGEGDERNLPIRSLTRTVDLSGLTSAMLSFDYRIWQPNNRDYGKLYVKVSDDGGVSWNNVTWYQLSSDMTGRSSFNISSYLSADTRIRFVMEPGRNGRVAGYMYFDNIDIRPAPPMPPLPPLY